MTQYRFTKKDGSVFFEFLDVDSPEGIARLRKLMALRGATKAEPVAPPPCPRCSGPVCPIIETEGA